MTIYVRGATRPKQLTPQEVMAAEVEARKLATRIQTATKDRDRLRIKLTAIRQDITNTRRAIDRAQTGYNLAVEQANQDAARILLAAERDADAIRERAYNQARALRDRAYTSGLDRAHDEARARTTVLKTKRRQP